MNRWPGYYDVVILPSGSVRDYSIELSRRLRRCGGRWSLGKRAFLPHISLYHIPVSEENLEAFKQELQRVADDATWGSLETAGFDMPLLMLDKPPWLRDLHWKVVRRTARYFDRDYGAEDTWDLHWFSGRRLELARRYLERYGSPMIGQNFRPHITLSSFKAVEDMEPVELGFKKLRFHADALYLCELGPSHSCQRVVWSSL